MSSFLNIVAVPVTLVHLWTEVSAQTRSPLSRSITINVQPHWHRLAGD